MSDSDYPKLRNVEFVPTSVGGRQGLVLRDPFCYTDKILFVPREVVGIIQFFDGTKTYREIREEIFRRSGSTVAEDDIKKIADELDDSHYLFSESFLKQKRHIDEDFFGSPIRVPAHAGAGYSADPQELRSELASYFSAAAADAGDGQPHGALAAAIAPHISINAGGASFARVYEAIRAAGPADLYVILGVGHAGIEELFAGTTKDFATPLGTAATDRAFMDDLSRRFGDRLFGGQILHRTEHTIEFQTVFLKYVFGDAPFTIAPILTSFPHTIFLHDRFSDVRAVAEDFIGALRGALAAYPGRAVVLASVDFSHVGVKYGDDDPPTAEDIQQVKERDREMIEVIAAGDARGFLEHIAADDDGRRICGFPAIYTMLSVIDGAKGRLIAYDATVMDQDNSTVTFAGMTFGAAPRHKP
ncbi:MAG: AmmeMemoRadiSam system protein B [Deltaproteobacteria bacterium]|nr:AmmeMemoRadiSam system protein B [Candidatus Zymogenaceae bacterium]